MKKLLTLALLVGVFAFSSNAEVLIGVYTDENPANSETNANVVEYIPTTIYVVAYWETGDVGEGITAAEFAIRNLPGSPGYPTGTTTITDSSDLVIGDLYTNYAIAYSVPMGGASNRMTIATIEILAFDPTWIGQDVKLFVIHGDSSGKLVVVDSDFEIVHSNGQGFTLNCSAECDFTSSASSTWSLVKSTF